jgi:hypothetical protein
MLLPLIIVLYPNANDAEMKDLSIGGFADVLFSPSGTLLNNNLTQLITEAGFMCRMILFNN